MANLNKHIKSDTVKWVIVFILIAALIAGVIALAWNSTNWFDWAKPDEQVEEEVEKKSDDIGSHAMNISVTNSNVMSLSASEAELAEDTRRITATVTPSFVDVTINWTMSFQSYGHDDVPENVEDYLSLSYVTDDRKTVDIKCLQPFKFPVSIVASLQDEDISASCTVDYKERFLGARFFSMFGAFQFDDRDSSRVTYRYNNVKTSFAEMTITPYHSEGSMLWLGRGPGQGQIFYDIYVATTPAFASNASSHVKFPVEMSTNYSLFGTYTIGGKFETSIAAGNSFIGLFNLLCPTLNASGTTDNYGNLTDTPTYNESVFYNLCNLLYANISGYSYKYPVFTFKIVERFDDGETREANIKNVDVNISYTSIPSVSGMTLDNESVVY